MDRSEQTQRPGHQRNRSRGLSFQSNKSGGSNKPKESLRESSEEKHRLHLSNKGKADPNLAMNEAQPVAAALEASTLGSLSSVRHVDATGNPISEPDLSNPTRSRWERPLDTIRSFDRAIDAEFKRKQSIARADAFNNDPNGYASRRSSYYGGKKRVHASRSQASMRSPPPHAPRHHHYPSHHLMPASEEPRSNVNSPHPW